jgi:hypothetical protein
MRGIPVMGRTTLAAMDSEMPAFEVHYQDRVLKVWADGRISGFPKEHPCVIINRIPALAAYERSVGLVFAKNG